MASQVPPSKPQTTGSPAQEVWDVELLHVNVSRKGKLVNAEWAIHPQIKADLSADEWKEIGDLMAKVTAIVGNRFSQALSEVEPDPPGHA
jgi:hypothetical protein